MKIEFNNGRIFIDGQEVDYIAFRGRTPDMAFPVADTNAVFVDTSASETTAAIVGDGNVVIQNSRNVITPGSVISVKGDFHLGDG